MFFIMYVLLIIKNKIKDFLFFYVIICKLSREMLVYWVCINILYMLLNIIKSGLCDN